MPLHLARSVPLQETLDAAGVAGDRHVLDQTGRNAGGEQGAVDGAPNRAGMHGAPAGMKVDDQDVFLPQRQGERQRAAQLYARSHRGSRGAGISPARSDQSRPAVALYNPDDACT
jgi:hypothetical protein